MRFIKILNKKELLENATRNNDKKARKLTLQILNTVLDSLDPRKIIKNHVHRENNLLFIDNQSFNLDKFQYVYVVGGGKASGFMAEALEEILGDKIAEGLINVLRKTQSIFNTRKIEFNEASHPIPDEAGLVGARKIVHLAKKAKKNDLVICLISGGGSALLPLPSKGITLKDQKNLTEALLKSGSSINEINIVRKHLSDLKGGRLAKTASPATVISLILSDVVDNSIDVIASGPTAPDKTTFYDAISVLKKYDLWNIYTPQQVKERLEAGLKNAIPETLKPGDKIFEKIHNFVIGSTRFATLTAFHKAKALGFNSILLSSMVEGEARHVGTVYAGILKEIMHSKNPIPRPAAIISGGETTVTVAGYGKGGRNQELVQSASSRISGLSGVAIASINTDGIDGPTSAAGAIADGQTINRAQEKKLSCAEFLINNDSFNFFSKLSDLIFTGPTYTNVGDLTVMVVV
ncbi:MAG: glycerate kinase [Candidatus Bathyarchaeota archaeon]|nr:glycerate kinase [Candidatus Bathyarchaeota archaeon]